MTEQPLPAFRETMNAISGWMERDLKTLDKNAREVIGANILSDALGEPSHSSPSLAHKDPLRAKLGEVLLGLHGAFLRFPQIRVAAKYYPWRGRISRHEHLEMMSHLFLAEVYVYEERLRQYLDTCMQCERLWKCGVDVKALKERALRVYRAHFKRLLRARHTHTHLNDVRFPEISRLHLIHLLSIDGDKFGLSKFARRAFNIAKKKLIKDIDGVVRDLGELTSVVFTQTKPIWSRL